MEITVVIVLWVLAGMLVTLGLAGLFFPAIPGAVLLFAGLVLAAWADDFAYAGKGTLILLGGLALLTYPADFIASAFGAKRFGASPRAVAGAAIGAVAGLFFGVLGVLLGPFVGAVIGEYSTQRNIENAGRAGIGATLGLVLGVAAKLAIAFTMLGIFAIVRFAS